MKSREKKEILLKAQDWFVKNVVENHAKNTKKLAQPSSFNINPFTSVYLANFLSGDSSPISIARALVYSRALGTSIVTTFGTHIQKFASEVLGSFGSTTGGVDIEFVDQVDKRKKFCQLKAGPNTINKDDVKTINDHFKEIRGRARANHLDLGQNDLILGVVYGEPTELSGHYRRLTEEYNIPVHVGGDFWNRLTGDSDFYFDLIASIREVAEETNFTAELEAVVIKLSKTKKIIEISKGGDPV